MDETFLALLAAHLMADFPLQPTWLLQRKRNVAVLILHALFVAFVAYIFLGYWSWCLLALLLGTHLVMDAIKIHALKDTFASFAIDQIVHLTVIAGLAYAFPYTVQNGWWARIPAEWLSYYLVLLSLLSGIILNQQVGAIIVRKTIAPFVAQIGNDIEGLQNGGFYIGCLERGLVMLLVLINQPTGVGFLITAKSILRFGDIKEPGQRKMTEYIIIGTFLSFGWGLLTAVATQMAISHWLT